jgi:hypothetical protein
MVADYSIAPQYPEPGHPKPAHHWLFEFERPPQDEAAFMKTIDGAIRAVNEDYDTHRKDDYGMEFPTLVRVAQGTFYRWMKERGKLGGQHKVPRVVRSKEMEKELLAISKELGP